MQAVGMVAGKRMNRMVEVDINVKDHAMNFCSR